MKTKGLSDESMRKVADALGPEDEYKEPSYWESIESTAQGIKDEFKEYPDTEVSELVWQSVDGSAWIIYYANNLDVLQQSNNSDAIDDAGVEIDTSRGWRHILTPVAFYAMEADVWEALRDLGWDGDSFGDEEDDFEDEEY